jgi:hypothetical protein
MQVQFGESHQSQATISDASKFLFTVNDDISWNNQRATTMTTTMSNTIPVGSNDIASRMADIASAPNPHLSKLATRYRGVGLSTSDTCFITDHYPGNSRRSRSSLGLILQSHRSHLSRPSLSLRARLHSSHRCFLFEPRTPWLPIYPASANPPRHRQSKRNRRSIKSHGQVPEKGKGL